MRKRIVVVVVVGVGERQDGLRGLLRRWDEE